MQKKITFFFKEQLHERYWEITDTKFPKMLQKFFLNEFKFATNFYPRSVVVNIDQECFKIENQYFSEKCF